MDDLILLTDGSVNTRSNIGYGATTTPNFACHICVNAVPACCTEMDLCVGDSSPAAVQACIDCLNEPTGTACMAASQAVQDAAAAYDTCEQANCAAECPTA